MTVELLSILAMFVGGCALLRTGGLRGWPLPALGFLAGVAVYIGIGLVQVLTPLPTVPALTLALTAGAPLGWWLVSLLRGRDVSVSVPQAGLALLAVVAAVAAFRWLHLVNYHYDSFRYLMSSAMLASDDFRAAVSINLITKRLLGVPLLHAPAQLAGEYYLRSIFPLIAIATVAAVVWLFREGVRERATAAQLATFTVLGVLLLVSINRFVFNAFYVNGHLLFATCTLLAAGGGWLLATSDRVPARALMVLQLVVIPAGVVTRAEAPIMLSVALLPSLLCERIPLRHRASVLAVLGSSTALWQGVVVLEYQERNTDLPHSASGVLLLGLLMLLLIPLLWWRPLTRHANAVLWLAGTGLGLGLLFFSVREPQTLRASLRATVDNVALGHGSWGASLVVLGVLVLGMVLLVRSPQQAHLHFALTTFMPLVLIVAYLREAAYRVGDHDSLNRMFIQIVPLAVLYLMVAMTSGDWRFTRTREEPADQRAAGTELLAVDGR